MPDYQEYLRKRNVEWHQLEALSILHCEKALAFLEQPFEMASEEKVKLHITREIRRNRTRIDEIKAKDKEHGDYLKSKGIQVTPLPLPEK